MRNGAYFRAVDQHVKGAEFFRGCKAHATVIFWLQQRFWFPRPSAPGAILLSHVQKLRVMGPCKLYFMLPPRKACYAL